MARGAELRARGIDPYKGTGVDEGPRRRLGARALVAAGSVVPAFQLLEAVNKGTLDGGHGVVAYHYGKNSALALWGSGPGFGMDPNMVLAWHNYGGGKALLAEVVAEPGRYGRFATLPPHLGRT